MLKVIKLFWNPAWNVAVLVGTQMSTLYAGFRTTSDWLHVKVSESQEFTGVIRDPVARCSCWLQHRIYTDYWAPHKHPKNKPLSTWAILGFSPPSLPEEDRERSERLDNPKSKWLLLLSTTTALLFARGTGEGKLISWWAFLSVALALENISHSFPLACRQDVRQTEATAPAHLNSICVLLTPF